MSTSDSHSHANHGQPGFVNEKMSTAGTRPFLRIHSPTRTCHPVSESVRSQPTPVVHQNNTRIGIRNATSDRGGTHEGRDAAKTEDGSVANTRPQIRVVGIASSRCEGSTSKRTTAC